MCYNPKFMFVTVKDKNNPDDYGKNIPILAECGKCYQCRMKRLSNWSLRLTHEYTTNFVGNMVMVTLTYNDEHNEDKSLDYTHIQLFIKRIRKKLPSNHKIKYMVVGEYGFNSERKHWHLVILGLNRNAHYELIKNSWHYGFIVIKNADVNSVKYLMKYSFKQQFKDKYYYIDKGLVPPMFRVSQAFGKDYVITHANILAERRFFIKNNFKVGMPRYYRKILIDLGYITYDYYLNDYNIFDIAMKSIKLLDNVPPDVVCSLNELFDSDKFTTDFKLECFVSHFKYYAYSVNQLKYNKFIKDFKEQI